MRELFRNLPAALERLQKLSALNARWCASATQAIPALRSAACREAAVRTLSAHQLIDFDLEEGGE